MRDKTVEQLLERTVDILMLRANVMPSDNQSVQVTAARKICTEEYITAVRTYFGVQYRTTQITQAPADVIDTIDTLGRTLGDFVRRVDSDYLPEKIHPAFVFQGFPTRELFDKVKRQLELIDTHQHEPTDHIARILDSILALLVREGLIA